jgi:hypothetical protein
MVGVLGDGVFRVESEAAEFIVMHRFVAVAAVEEVLVGVEVEGVTLRKHGGRQCPDRRLDYRRM